MRLIASCACLFVLAVSIRAAQAPATDRTVWDGVYTTAQADRGRVLYAAHCAACHGGALEGGEGKALVDETFWTDWREQTVGDLLTYVSTNMPFSEDGSLKGTLSMSTYADIVAHMLAANALPPGPQELTQASSRSIRIASKDGSTELPGSTLAVVVGCLAPRAGNADWRIVRATRPVRTTGPATPPADATLGDREFALKFVLRNLTGLVGHRVAVTGLLLGEGGVDGINVNTVESVATSCG